MANNHAVKIQQDNLVSIVPFSLQYGGGQEIKMALNAHKVVRVIELEQFEPLPKEYEPFTGVISFESIVVPLFDLKHFFHGSDTAQVTSIDAIATKMTNKRVIICSFQNIYVGLIVDKTRKLQHQLNSEMLPPPAAISQGERPHFSAVIPDGPGSMYLLDIEAILQKSGIDLNEDRASKSQTKILQGKQILVIEDSRLFQKRCVQVLERHGATTLVANNGKEGLELLQKENYRFDLIFLDIEMPIMNGIEMATIVKSGPGKDIPLLFNSAISNPALIADLKSQGLGDYIVKFDESAILEKLTKFF